MLMNTGVAVGMVTGMIPLPERWIKPVVDVVLVPAHSQISPPCPSIILDDIRIDCSISLGQEHIIVQIDDISEANCPILLVNANNDGYSLNILKYSYIESYEDRGKLIGVDFNSGLDSLTHVEQYCRPELNDPDSSFPFTYWFEALSGESWRLTATIIKGSSPSPYIEVSDIQLVKEEPRR